MVIVDPIFEDLVTLKGISMVESYVLSLIVSGISNPLFRGL